MPIISFITIFFFSFTTLLSDEKILNLDDAYKLGLKYYNQDNYTASYNIFKEIFLKKLSDSTFNYYFGKSAYELGNYEVALAAFERVDMLDDTNIFNSIYMARTYAKLRMYEDASLIYISLLSNPNLPHNVKKNIELSLSHISQVQQKMYTYASIRADILYDSNINYGSINDYEFLGLTLNRIEEISATALQVNANITNIYDLGQKNGFALRNSLSISSKDYKDYKSYDLLYFNYQASLFYHETFYNIALNLAIDSLHLADKELFKSYALNPTFAYSHSPLLQSNFALKYQHKFFDNPSQKDLDSHRYEFTYGLQKLTSPQSYFKASATYISERKVRGTNIYVNYNEFKLNANYFKQFSSSYTFGGYIQYRNKQYKDFSSGFNSTRKDFIYLGNISLTMKMTESVKLYMNTSHEYVKSNQDRFTYKKTTLATGVIKTF